ncbi:DUF4135 domain-containing protein [Actinokineospora sp. 24-640]
MTNRIPHRLGEGAALVEQCLDVLAGRLKPAMPYAAPEELAAVLHGARRWLSEAPIDHDTLLGRLTAVVAFAEDFALDQDRLVVLAAGTRLVGTTFDHRSARDTGRPVVHLSLDGGRLRYKPWACPSDMPLRGMVEAVFGADTAVRVPRCVDRGSYGWAEVLPDPPDPVGAVAHRGLGHLLAIDRALVSVGAGVYDVTTSGEHVRVMDCGRRRAAPWKVDGIPWRPDRRHPSWSQVELGFGEGVERVRAAIADGGLDVVLHRFLGASETWKAPSDSEWSL